MSYQITSQNIGLSRTVLAAYDPPDTFEQISEEFTQGIPANQPKLRHMSACNISNPFILDVILTCTSQHIEETICQNAPEFLFEYLDPAPITY